MANESDVKPPKTASSTVADVKSSDSNSSTATNPPTDGTKSNDVKADQTLLEAVQEQLAKNESSSSGDKKDAKESGSKNEPNPENEDKAQSEEAKKEAQTTEEDKKEESSEEETEKKNEEAVPYERFKEMVDENNKLKETIASVKSVVQNYNNIEEFCAKNAITGEQFNSAMELQALLNTDPVKALEKLQPIIDQLQGFVGGKLPADLQKEVDDGDLTVPRAKEIAQLRAKNQFGSKKLEFDQKRLEQEQQTHLQRGFVEAANAWETSHRKADPDYKPKAKETDPDGKWEDVKYRVLAMMHEVDAKGQPLNQVNSPNDLTALMERAYKAVSNRSVKRPATTKHLSSNGSSSTSKPKPIEEAPTMAEAVTLHLAAKR